MIGAVLVCTALSWANSPTPPPACPTIGCDGTAAHGSDAVAVGFATNARGLNAVAMGFSTTAKGNIATAMGSNTTASGDFATAMGWSTVAECGGAEPSNNGACVALGFNTVNHEPESLAVSGNAHAKNVKLFGADARLAQNVTDADPSALLAGVERVRVVTRSPSERYCRHQGRTPADCAADVRVAMLAQQVAEAVPGAVGSGASIALVDAAAARAQARVRASATTAGGDGAQAQQQQRQHQPRVLEQLDALQGLDVHVLLAQLVGAVQALSKQNRALAQRVATLETLGA